MMVLVDTCVVIDVLQSREPFAKEAQEIFVFAADGKIPAGHMAGCVKGED